MYKNNDLEFYRQKILLLLRNDKEELAKKMIKKIVSDSLKKDDDIALYKFFSPIYDELFYDMMFENIKITFETRELLETLAMPQYKMKK